MFGTYGELHLRVGKKMQSGSEVPNSVPSPGSRSKNSTPRASSAYSNESGRDNNEVEPKSTNKEVTSQHSGNATSSAEANPDIENSTLSKHSSTSVPDWNESDSGKPAQQVEPKYKVVYRNHFDLTQFWYAPNHIHRH